MDKIIAYLQENPNYVIGLAVTFAVLIVACVLGYIIKKYNLLRFMDGWFKKKPKCDAEEKQPKASKQDKEDNGFGFEFDDPADLVRKEREADGLPVEPELEQNELDCQEDCQPVNEEERKKSRFSEMIFKSLEDDAIKEYEENKKLTTPHVVAKPAEIVIETQTPEIIEQEAKLEGSWRIMRCGTTYVAELHSEDGRLLLKSQNYSALGDARTAIDALKKHISGNNFSIVAGRDGKYCFKLLSTAGRLITNGEPCQTRNDCIQMIDEVKRIAFTAEIVRG